MTGPGLARVLAAAAPPKGDPVAVAIWVGALILVVVGAGLAVMAIRRRLFARPQDTGSVAGSWLDELRAMHRRGQIDDEEFKAARASLLAKVSGTPIPVRPPAPDPAVLVARPGFDLTGEPLPAARPTPPQGSAPAPDSPTRDPIPPPDSIDGAEPNADPDRPPSSHG